MPVSEAFQLWRAEGRTYRHRGHSVFYRDQGDGPVLLAIHGFPAASWDWHLIWSALTARFRVIAPDMLGYGWSDKPRHYPYSIADQADLHQGLLRELGVARCHVLAHDVGVSVAAELLARQQHGSQVLTVQSLCLLNGGVFPESHRPRPIQRLLASSAGPYLAPHMRRFTFALGLRSVFAKPPSQTLVDELWRLLMHQDGRHILPALLGYMEERRQMRERWVSPILQPLVPTRLIDGTADPVSGKTLVDRYREQVPHADVVELPEAGHWPQLEDPVPVLRAFFAFHEQGQLESARQGT